MKSLLLFATFLVVGASLGQEEDTKMSFGINAIYNVQVPMYGAEFFVSPDSESFVGYYFSFGNITEGEQLTAFENTGIYEIGQYGNILTGQEKDYTEESFIRHNFSFGYALFKSEKLLIIPTLGIGFTNKRTFSETYLAAEDITSGYNVLGDYWVQQLTPTRKNELTPNFSLGIKVNYSLLNFGIGYDANPNGLTVLLGVKL